MSRLFLHFEFEASMDYQAARRHMVDSQVRPNDVTDLRLQLAMEEIPREIFLPPELRDQAYVEREVAYAPERYLLRARDFSKLVGSAEPRETDLVLNAVCGSGYSTAILSRLTEMVVSVESDEKLAQAAEANLNSLDISNAAVINADPREGAAGQGPFDLIFIGGVIELKPEKLLQQLKDGGRLATLKMRGGIARGVIYRRSGDVFGLSELFDAASTAVLSEFKAPKTFKF